MQPAWKVTSTPAPVPVLGQFGAGQFGAGQFGVDNLANGQFGAWTIWRGQFGANLNILVHYLGCLKCNQMSGVKYNKSI